MYTFMSNSRKCNLSRLIGVSISHETKTPKFEHPSMLRYIYASRAMSAYYLLISLVMVNKYLNVSLD